MTWACHDLETCIQCQKLSSCVEVWQQIRAPEDKNEVCGMCTIMVSQAKQKPFTSGDQNLEQIVNVVCKLQMTSDARDKCFRIMDETGPELARMLSSDISSNTLCTLAGFCNKGNSLQIIRDQYIVSTPMMMPEELKDANCRNCKQNTKLDLAYFLFQSKSEATNAGDSFKCDFCHSTVSYLKEILDASTTKELCKEQLERFCGHVKEYSDECNQLIDDHFDQVYDYLAKGLDPLQVCQALLLCEKQDPRRSLFTGFQPIPLVSSRHVYASVLTVRIEPSSNQVNRINGNVETNSVQETNLEEDSNNFITCELCKEVMATLEKKLGENRTEAAIRKALEKVCNIVPKHWRSKCTDFVDKHVDQIVKLLTQKVPPAMICRLLGVCSAAPEVQRQQFPSSRTNFKGNHISESHSKDNDFLTCEVCKEVMSYLEKQLGQNRTEEAIRKALDKVCNVLPKHWRGKCTHFVDKYSDMIVELLQKEVAPSAVCKAIGVCSAEPTVFQLFTHRGVKHVHRTP